MKVFRIPVFILLLFLALSFISSTLLSRQCADWNVSLEAADQAVLAGDWDRVRDEIHTFSGDWDRCQSWLHILIEHRKIDGVESLLRRCVILGDEEAYMEMRLTLTQLRAQLQALEETEHISLKNIL